MGRKHLRVLTALLGVCIGAFSAVHAQYYEDTMEPAEIGIKDIGKLRVPKAAYAGNDACRQCHEAAYQKWLATKHARSFVPMRSMMGMMMGEEQGVTACCPAKSGKCLPCHATAHDVPAAHRGPGFRMGEGVACEKCHGPGGDHVQAMEDPKSGADGTVEVPGEDFCWTCHQPKKSHEKLESHPFNRAKAWKKIAHPMSMERPEDEMEPAELGIWHVEEPRIPGAAYVGSAACGRCHEGAYQKWAESKHARSFMAMRSEMGYMMDMMGSVTTIGGPARNGMCLSCHATAHDVPAAYRGPGFRMGEGVACEKCHGPGGDHVQAMENHESSADMGLKEQPTDKSCMMCHKRKRSHEKLKRGRFSFPKAWEMIAH